MKNGGSLSTRVFFTILIGGALIITALCAFGANEVRSSRELAAQEAAGRIAAMIDKRFASDSRPVKMRGEAVAAHPSLASQFVLYDASVPSTQLYEFMALQMRDCKDLTSIGVMFDPTEYGRSADEIPHAPFVVRSGDMLGRIDAAASSSAYMGAPIFKVASADRTPMWAEAPEEISRVLRGAMSSLCLMIPVRGGVVVCSVPNELLVDAVDGAEAPFGGSFRIASREGGDLYRTAGAAGGSDVMMFAADMPATGWRLELFCPESEIAGFSGGLAMKMIGAGAVLLALTLFAAFASTSAVTRALADMSKRIDEFAESPGEIDISRGPSPVAELNDLARSIDAMNLEMSKRVAGSERTMMEDLREREDSEAVFEIRKKILSPTSILDKRFAVGARVGVRSVQNGIFYEILKSDRATVYMAIGEADSGDASAMMSVCSVLSLLRAVLANCPETRVGLDQLSRHLAKNRAGCTRVPLLLAEFYPSTGTCSVSCAGMNAVGIIRDSVPARVEIPTSSPISQSANDFSSVILNLRRGDALVFCSSKVAMTDAALEQLGTQTSLALYSSSSFDEAVSSLSIDEEGVAMVLQYR